MTTYNSRNIRYEVGLKAEAKSKCPVLQLICNTYQVTDHPSFSAFSQEYRKYARREGVKFIRMPSKNVNLVVVPYREITKFTSVW